MPSDNTERPDTNVLMAALGQTGGALATASTEFLSRVIEIGGRRAGDAIAQALASSQGAGSGWIDKLLGSYRDALGEMATTLPLVAQRLSQGLQTGAENRLLLRTCDVLGGSQDLLLTTEATLERLKMCAAREGLPPIQLPGLLDSLPKLLDGEKVRDLPKLFDRLKYDFRRRGRRALPGIRKELLWLIGDDHESLYALVDALTASLGEACLPKVLRKELLNQYAKALCGSGARIPADIEKALRCRFAKAGIELSAELSLLTYRHERLLLDHDRDRFFEVRTCGEEQLEVYGEQEGNRYTADGKDLLLPLRVQDASQGMAVWSVDKRLVQDELDNDQGAGLFLRAWDMGANRTPVALFMVEYREGDLGPYLELGLGCFATPKKDPLAVGMYVLGELPVTTALACEAGKTIWGYPKTLASLDIRYRDRTVTCWLRKAGEDGHPPKDMLELTLPRGGEGSSGPIPLFSYTLKPDCPPDCKPPPKADSTPPSIPDPIPHSWHRTVITRSGTGETLHGGGKVAVTITADGDGNGLCDAIRRLGLVDDKGKLARRPLFATWTEHVAAELGAPRVVVVPEWDDKPADGE